MYVEGQLKLPFNKNSIEDTLKIYKKILNLIFKVCENPSI